jgi:hypothetical protein
MSLPRHPLESAAGRASLARIGRQLEVGGSGADVELGAGHRGFSQLKCASVRARKGGVL